MNSHRDPSGTDLCLFCGLALDRCLCPLDVDQVPTVDLDRLVTLDPRPHVPFPTVIGLGDLMAEVRADLEARRDFGAC
jgi:hypothetical protein